MFLPVGDEWSLDAVLRRRKKGSVRGNTENEKAEQRPSVFVNPATVALKLLVFWIYLDAGLGKYFDPKHGWTYHADPLPALDTYARHTVFAQHLYGLLGPEGLRFLTPIVVYVEILCVPVALVGSYLGNTSIVYGAIGAICQMHLGISLSIRNSNLLSYVACCVWLVFLPMGWKKNNDDGPTTTSDASADRVAISQSRASQRSFWNKLGSLVTLMMVSAMVGGNIWFETIATGCTTESLRLIWSTLLQNRWNVFVGAEEVSHTSRYERTKKQTTKLCFMLCLRAGLFSPCILCFMFVLCWRSLVTSDFSSSSIPFFSFRSVFFPPFLHSFIHSLPVCYLGDRSGTSGGRIGGRCMGKE